MTKEDKELVLKDLCARLPYKVKIQVTWWSGIQGASINTTLDSDYIDELIDDNSGDIEIKPYLRLMSSMTEEEKEEIEHLAGSIVCYNELEGGSTLFDEVGLDWLNSHHFDYRGLIKKGLALEATEEIYKWQ